MLDEALADAPDGMPAPGEDAAWRRLRAFLEKDLDGYADLRNDPGADRTSRLSPYLKLGLLHPRQILAQTAESRAAGARTFENEIAWRDFYADVLHHNPRSAWEDLRPVARPDLRRPRGRHRGLEAAARPASRSSTPACGSWSPRAGCTTGSG